MEIIKAIIFGIVEGITEWLPISSTGHMILIDEFIKLKVSDEFYILFQVVIQLGAILAVLLLYFKTIFPWGFNKTKEDTKKTFSLWFKIAFACVPAIIFGLFLDDWMDEHFYNAIVVAVALIVYGILFIVIESKNIGKRQTKSIDDITYKQAFEIGLFQLLALVPGTSRSGSTILGGLLIGLERNVVAKFTFLLGIPVMFGASVLKLFKYILKVGFHFQKIEIAVLLAGSIVAFLVSLFVIKFVMNYIKKHDFKVFGWYRIALGIIVLLYFVLR